MIIYEIELENIRSYKHEVVNFTENINFLSGDIGSGKSSILLAIEFALFGFKRGDLEGFQLLRNGEKEGLIKLILKNTQNNEKVEIVRNLKRNKSGDVVQGNGNVLFKGNLIELSPQELNGFVFKLLNFPLEFLTKDKNLIYRFTIYTPQEQLKEILFTTPDKRLEIIRKIFNIDKYKQLNDSISVYLGKIREEKKVFLAKLEPQEKLKKDVENNVNKKVENLKMLVEIKKKETDNLEKKEKYEVAIKKREDIIEKLNNEILKFEKQISKFKEIDKQIENINLKIKKRENEVENVNKDKINENIKSNLELIELLNVNLKYIEKNKEKIEEALEDYDKIIKNKELILNEISNFNNLMKNSNELEKSFDYKLTKCQIKDLENVVKKEGSKIKKIPIFEKKINILKEKIYKEEISVKKLKKERRKKREEREKIEKIKVCKTCLQEVGKEHKHIIENKLKNEIVNISKEVENLTKTIVKAKIELKRQEKECFELNLIKDEFLKKEEKLLFLKEKEKKESILLDKLKSIKKKLEEKKKKRLEEKKRKIEEKILKIEKIRKSQIKLKNDEVEFNKKISNIKIEVLKLENLKKNIISNEKEIKIYEKEIEIAKKKIKNSSEIKLKCETIVENHLRLKNEKNRLNLNLNKINENLRIISMKISSIDTQIKNFDKEIREKEKNIQILDKLSKKYEKILENEYLLSKIVVNIATDIERQVFSKYYSEFSYEFEKMFKNLIEDNEIDVRLNSEFTPIIEQNGFEIEIRSLSGGEKSSLAIAYRLGLKKIIEDNLEEKQKLSLLILDEPTDGFSDNQISRLGDLIKMSNLKQIILVSHDEKIESISDFVINVEKNNHESYIN